MGKYQQREEITKKQFRFSFLFFLSSVAVFVLGSLIINEMQTSWIRRYRTLWIALIFTLSVGLCALSVWGLFSNREKLFKSLLISYVFILFCLSFVYILQKTGFFAVVKDADALESYLRKSGVWMPVFYVLLQFLQVIILPIPAIVSTAAGVALFGAFRATIYSLIGILLGSIAAFFIGRKLGGGAVSWIVGKENLKKWKKKLKGKDNLVLTLMFLLPLFPDDVLCFLAGLSSMTNTYFLCMIVFTRVTGIVVTCYFVRYVPFTTWWGALIWGCVCAVVIFFAVVVYKNLDKIQNRLKRKKE